MACLTLLEIHVIHTASSDVISEEANALLRTWKGVFVAWCELLSWHLSGRNGGNHNILRL